MPLGPAFTEESTSRGNRAPRVWGTLYAPEASSLTPYVSRFLHYNSFAMSILQTIIRQKCNVVIRRFSYLSDLGSIIYE